MVMNFDNYSTSFQSLMGPMYNVQANYSAMTGGYGNGYGAGFGMGGYYPGMGAGYMGMGMGGFMTPMNGVGIGQFNADYLIKNDEKFKDMIPDIDLFTLPIMDCIVNKQYGKRPFSCFAGSGGCAVMPNGDIYPCGRFGSNKLFKYGNVLEELNKEEIQKINKNVYINPVEIKECKSCKLYKYCNAGCTYSQIKNNYKPLESICELYHIVYDKAFKWYNILKENNVAIDRRIKTALQNID